MHRLLQNLSFISPKSVNKCGLKDGVYIYGLSRETKQISECIGKTNVKGYIDTYKGGKGYFYDEIEIFSPEQIKKCYCNEPIIIAASRYYYDICLILDNNNLIKKNNVFIWDENGLFLKDNNVVDLINYFEDTLNYSRCNIATPKLNEVLVAIDNYHDNLIVRSAFLSRFFANEYDANIKAYCSFGFDAKNVSPVIFDIYRSFGTDEVIDTELNLLQEKESETIANDLWRNLYSWEDWKQIHVYGIHFGTTMLRDFFRRNIPLDDIRDKFMLDYLKRYIRTIVFWKYYFDNHKVCVALLLDGTNWDGFIRDIAIKSGARVYSLAKRVRKLTLDFAEFSMYQYFDKMWLQLTDDEKQYGRDWAKKRIEARIKGNTKDVAIVDKKNFAFKNIIQNNRVLTNSDKCKVVICPHSFEEDSYWYGNHLFGDNYYAWLSHLGELSNTTPELEWYLKWHPSSTRRDYIIIGNFLNKFKNIIPLSSDISPLQLKEEGMRFAFTESGTIGHEYPAIGINVINAGINPHSKYQFCINPSSKEEFDFIVRNLHEYEFNPDLNSLYEFYAMKYLYYDWDAIPDRKAFGYVDDLIFDRKERFALGKKLDSSQYKEYLDSIDKSSDIFGRMGDFVRIVDDWRDDFFYRRQVANDNC